MKNATQDNPNETSPLRESQEIGDVEGAAVKNEDYSTLQHHPESSEPATLITVDKTPLEGKEGFFRRYLKLVCNLKFVALLQLIFGFSLAISISSAFLPSLALEHGNDSYQGASLLSVLAIANIIIIPIMGVVMDKPAVRQRRWIAYCACQAGTGTSLLLCPLATSYAGLIVLVFINGLCNGVVMSQRVTVVGDVLGRARTRDGIALMSVVFSVGALIGRIITGERCHVGVG